MNPIFEPTEDGIEIIDMTERRRYRLITDNQVRTNEVEVTPTPYPVDNAAEIMTDSITLPTKSAVYVYDRTGSMIAESDPHGKTVLPQNKYSLDISGPVKLYANVDSSVEIGLHSNQTHIDFGDPTEVVLGARSYHTQPAGSITTTVEPADVMQVVSAFGSALKTTKPERSYPTLRGHPPTIEVGQRLDIPFQFESPDTGISIEVPADLQSIFVVTPLAYYLGAKVKHGSVPRLIMDSDQSFPLAGSREFESTVERLLKQTLFLDSLVRVAGPSSNPLQERHELKSVLPFNMTEVYNQSSTERLRTYLDVPFEMIESYLPDWRTSVLQPTEDKIPYLPFLAQDLTVVKTQSAQSRDTENNPVTGKVRTNMTTSAEVLDQSIEQRWTDGRLPQITAKVPLSAFYNDINRTVRADPIEIQVVCNDPGMGDELVALYSTYGSREDLPFEVRTHRELTVSELAALFEQTSDFVHYIGHTEREGFRCTDGHLDAWSLETAGMDAFLLNSCQSYDQGVALLEKGSIGGIVTLDDIDNIDAIHTGSTIAQLLNQGFPLYAAANIVREECTAGESYQIIGKGATAVSQSRAGLPIRFSISRDGECHQLRLKVYTKGTFQIGSTYQPHLSSTDAYHLIPKEIGPVQIVRADLPKITDMSEAAVLLEDGIRMGDEIKFKEIDLFDR
ncbi:hypothetical protein QA600_00330 [Natronococcus sp. A-GB1]|uniref:hypothetical protein n=1 Tax=Natronococcus sp. A-GB1 TaxID=3037648 RepID=UPI00241C4F90|nr:hypothetical protein [Natronococcus sp. A-GB1]MDG5757790.1 hypothetical protein [Natronococcus sp. A-GB1]